MRARVAELAPALGLLAGWTIVYAAAGGGTPGEAALVDAGAMWAPDVAAGAWWRLLTAPWLHRSALHLLGNAVGLGALWWMGARRLRAVPAIWLVGGAAGALASYLLGVRLSCGASGGLYAVGAATSGLALRAPGAVSEEEARRGGLVLGVGLLLSLALAALPSRVDLAAHLGGALAGGLLSWGARWRPVASPRGTPR